MTHSLPEPQFHKAEKKANENISKLWNPENKYSRVQKEILRSVFER